MKPLKLTFRPVLIAALVLVAFAAAFDGLRRYNRVNAERNDNGRQVQVEPARAALATTASS
jgi:hypothetical protein